MAIFLGARLGGIAIGFAGGLGVLVLALLGVTPGAVPLDVISIIMSVIAAIAAMQVAGGMDYLVDLADRALRKNPKHLNFLAPVLVRGPRCVAPGSAQVTTMSCTSRILTTMPRANVAA